MQISPKGFYSPPGSEKYTICPERTVAPFGEPCVSLDCLPMEPMFPSGLICCASLPRRANGVVSELRRDGRQQRRPHRMRLQGTTSRFFSYASLRVLSLMVSVPGCLCRLVTISRASPATRRCVRLRTCILSVCAPTVSQPNPSSSRSCVADPGLLPVPERRQLRAARRHLGQHAGHRWLVARQQRHRAIL